MINRLVLSILVTFLFSSVSAVAELKWTQQSITRDADFGQKKVVVDFQFINQSSEPVTITNTKTSCGCTVTQLAKKTYAPGEGGKLTANFDVGQRVGRQVKHITVNTDETANIEGYELTLTVNIPKAVTLRPRVVTWRTNEAPTPKTVRVTLHDDFSIPIESIVMQNSDAGNFTYKINEIHKGKTYTVTITPKEISRVSRGRVHLKSQHDKDNVLAKNLIYTFIRKVPPQKR